MVLGGPRLCVQIQSHPRVRLTAPSTLHIVSRQATNNPDLPFIWTDRMFHEHHNYPIPSQALSARPVGTIPSFTQSGSALRSPTSAQKVILVYANRASRVFSDTQPPTAVPAPRPGAQNFGSLMPSSAVFSSLDSTRAPAIHPLYPVHDAPKNLPAALLHPDEALWGTAHDSEVNIFLVDLHAATLVGRSPGDTPRPTYMGFNN